MSDSRSARVCSRARNSASRASDSSANSTTSAGMSRTCWAWSGGGGTRPRATIADLRATPRSVVRLRVMSLLLLPRVRLRKPARPVRPTIMRGPRTAPLSASDGKHRRSTGRKVGPGRGGEVTAADAGSVGGPVRRRPRAPWATRGARDAATSEMDRAIFGKLKEDGPGGQHPGRAPHRCAARSHPRKHAYAARGWPILAVTQLGERP